MVGKSYPLAYFYKIRGNFLLFSFNFPYNQLSFLLWEFVPLKGESGLNRLKMTQNKNASTFSANAFQMINKNKHNANILLFNNYMLHAYYFSMRIHRYSLYIPALYPFSVPKQESLIAYTFGYQYGIPIL